MKKNFSCFSFLVFISAFSLQPSAFLSAQVTVIGAGAKIPVSVSLGGPSGHDAASILASDLERSGCFKLETEGGEYSVKGTASANHVECEVEKSDGTAFAKATGSGEFRHAVHQAADAIVEKIAGQKGIAETHIAFISDKSGSKELYVMDYDGFHVQRFTQDHALLGAVRFSRQGDKIAFTSYRSGDPDVYIMEYPSGNRQRIAGFPGLNSGAAFSPNGSRIALTLSKDGNPELYTMSVGGGDLRRLTRGRGGKSSPTWSPDGSQIAYASDEGGRPQIYLIPSSGGMGARLTTYPAYNTEPNWSPDGAKIAYTSMEGNFEISALKLGEGGGESIYGDGRCECPSWAPDSRHLVFTRMVGNVSNLYILDTLTKEATQLSKVFGNCTEPAWSGR